MKETCRRPWSAEPSSTLCTSPGRRALSCQSSRRPQTDKQCSLRCSETLPSPRLRRVDARAAAWRSERRHSRAAARLSTRSELRGTAFNAASGVPVAWVCDPHPRAERDSRQSCLRYFKFQLSPSPGRWPDHSGKKLSSLFHRGGGMMSQRKAEFQNRGRRLLRRRFY